MSPCPRVRGFGYRTGLRVLSFPGQRSGLDGATGKQVWKSYTSRAKGLTRRLGTRRHPTLGPFWGADLERPTIDVKKNVLYVTTGDNSSFPATTTSDAFLAMSLDSGRILWSKQMTATDVWNSACRVADTTNCPQPRGPDFDFGAPPILVTLSNGRRALVAGQKSGSSTRSILIRTEQ